ncbi:MAG: glycine oxidase ThiO [Pseudomonadota bacterium]
MRNGFDIAIIGGGVIGLALARALVMRGAAVAVADAGAQIPAATNAAAGMLAPSFECGETCAEALYAFSAASLAAWPAFAGALEEETGCDIDFRGDGILGVVYDDKELRKSQKACENLKARGAEVEMLTGDEARRLEPALSPEVIGGLHAPRDAQVDPRKALIALRASFEKKGGAFIAARITHAQQSASGVMLHDERGARLEAKTLVLASGAAASAGIIDDLPLPPIFAVKGDAVALGDCSHLLRKVVRAPGAYLCPKAGGRLVIGASEAREYDDLLVDPVAVEALVRNGARAAPDIAHANETERWAGLRPATPDGAPILGRDPDGPGNVFLALGHYRNGVLLAPASAEALADEISASRPSVDLSAFQPDRFRDSVLRRHG